MASPERTLTIDEAAEATGLTQKALRRRIERGQLRSLLRDGRRHIPVAELHRVELIDPEGKPMRGSEWHEAPRGTTPGKPASAELQLDAVRLLARLEELAAENGRLRALPEQVERDWQQRFSTEAAARRQAEERLERLRQAGWRERRRLLRELRAQPTA